MKIWIAGVAVALAAAAAFALTQEEKVQTTAEKPALDLEVPEKLETATFALG
jgi:hypothetical protein